jgi:hypothetical protein
MQRREIRGDAAEFFKRKLFGRRCGGICEQNPSPTLPL